MSTLDFDMEMELGEITKPKNSVVLMLNLHFSGLAKSEFFRRCVRTSRMCFVCSSGFLEKIRILSR